MSEPVLVDQIGHTLLVTINRPEVRNAVNFAVCQRIGDAVERAQVDDDVRVLVLTGAGSRSFSAGADLKALARGETILPPGKEEWSFAGFANHFISKPTIAAVNGTALGGGCELALACDLVVASRAALFGLPEVTRGLIPGAGGAFRVVSQLPAKVGLRLLLTGRPITADEALRWGLVNEVAAPDAVLDVALQLAETVAANAPLAVQASKRIAYGYREGIVSSELACWRQTWAEDAANMASLDAAEGPRAFAEHRPPEWVGR